MRESTVYGNDKPCVVMGGADMSMCMQAKEILKVMMINSKGTVVAINGFGCYTF